MKIIHLLGIVVLTLTQVGFGADSSVAAKWRYNRADNLQLKFGSETVRIPSVSGAQMSVTDPGIAKAIFLKEKNVTINKTEANIWLTFSL